MIADYFLGIKNIHKCANTLEMGVSDLVISLMLVGKISEKMSDFSFFTNYKFCINLKQSMFLPLM